MSTSSFRHSEVPGAGGTSSSNGGYLDAPPTRAELERHYGLLKEERRRLEAMIGVTDRMLDGVRRALRDGRASPDIGERETVLSNGSGGEQQLQLQLQLQQQQQQQPSLVNGEAVRLRRDNRTAERSFGGESVWAVSSSSSVSTLPVEGSSS